MLFSYDCRDAQWPHYPLKKDLFSVLIVAEDFQLSLWLLTHGMHSINGQG